MRDHWRVAVPCVSDRVYGRRRRSLCLSHVWTDATTSSYWSVFRQTPTALDAVVNFCRAMLCKRCLCRRAVSVRPSVRPSRSWILSKQLNVRSVFFHRHHSSFSVMAIFWRGLPSTGASNSGGVGRNRDCLRIAVYRLMTAGRANNTCDNPRCSLSHRHDGSVNLCLSQPAACTTTTKRTERNLFVRNGKSEADIALDVLFCWSYWQTQSIARPLCDGRATCNSL